MHPKRTFLAALVGCLLVFVVSLQFSFQPRLQAAVRSFFQTASIFFVPSITTADLHRIYAAAESGAATSTVSSPQKIKILLVPGHEPYSGGTEYGGYAERDVAVDIANDLAALLEKNPRFEVMVARSKEAWNPTLSEYFNSHTQDIEAYRHQQMSLMNLYLSTGQVQPEGAQIDHVTAPSDTMLHLYGINKWANENGIDLTIHLHLNDYAGRRGAGRYSGFAIYVPNRQYSNAGASRAVAQAIAARLGAYHATSTLPGESAGIIEDQQLIAIGSNNSTDAASMLIEYGYIYEPQFKNLAIRPVAESEYAYQTYLGIQDFFNDPASTTGTNTLPAVLTAPTNPKDTSVGLYELQEALHRAGLYPPPGENFTDCPVTGYFGQCTAKALKAVENSAGIPATGAFDASTIRVLERWLGSSASFQTSGT